MDKYRNYNELSLSEKENDSGNGDYRISIQCEDTRNSKIAILAPHGGKIEPLTSEIASHIAAHAFCLYLFEGTKTNKNFENLHITSTNFDEPRCINLLRDAQLALAVHGKRGNNEYVGVGGMADELADKIFEAVRARGFAASRIKDGPLGGRSPRNICNRTRSRVGVQVEISLGLRRALVADENRRLGIFADAVSEILREELKDEDSTNP